MTDALALSRIEAFKPLPPEALAQLAALGRKRTFRPGTVLMRQGEPSDSVYAILNGLVRVERFHPALTEALVLAELGAGELVGEMGVLDGAPRSATVTAIVDTESVELSASTLASSLLRYPEATALLLRTFSRRLRSADELAEQICRGFPSSAFP